MWLWIKKLGKKCIGKTITFYEIEQKMDVLKLKTTKIIVDFCAEESASVKSFAKRKKRKKTKLRS